MSTLLQTGYDQLANSDLVKAQNTFVQLIKKEPNNGAAYLGLARVAKAAFQYDQAIALLQKACHLMDRQAEPLLALADAFSLVHSTTDVQTTLTYAYENCPYDKAVHAALLQHYIASGQTTAAEPLLWQQINASDPIFSAYGWLDLIRLWSKPLTSAEWDLLHKEYLTSTSDSEHRMLLDYALGQAYDKVKNYTKALEHLQMANAHQLSLCQYKTEQMSAFFALLCDQYQHVSFQQSNSNSANTAIVPVFIVGLPRTGSTLLEQMLCQHSEVNSCGEQSYLSQYSVPYLEKMTQLVFPHCVTKLAEFDTSAVSNHYLKLISIGLTEPLIINKLPANFQNIGLIYQLFPNAKVINITRDTKDVSVSVFKNYFFENEPYFCDIDEFARYAQLYQQQMDYWQGALPSKILTIGYESLVMDPQQTIEKVLSYLGVSWQDACVSVRDRERAVYTLSATQVRQPIHAHSIGQWQHYKALFS